MSADGGASGPAVAAALDTRKLAVARLWAASRHPYLATALFAQTVVPARIGRLAVDDGWRLHVDPEVVDELSLEVLGSLLVHLTGHLVRDHAARAQHVGVTQESAKDWRLAVDAEVNDDLVGTGLRLPEEFVFPQELGWNPGRMAEEYYRRQVADPPAHPDCGSGTDGIPRPWELLAGEGGGLPPGEAHLVRCFVAREVLRHSHEGLGRVPSSWRRWAEDLLEPKVDWRRMLAAEIRKGVTTVAGKVDYTYRRPSRRASAVPDVVLPALERPVPEVAIVVDTSASMSVEQLAQVLAEIQGLLRGIGMARTAVRVLAVDATVQTVQRVATSRQVNLLGGGGTDMGEGIAAAARLKPRPAVVVVLTDGLTPWPAEPPKGVPVVVGLIRNAAGQGRGSWTTPAWARVVDIETGTPG